MQKIELTKNVDLCEHFEKFLSGEEKGIIKLAVPVANINEWKDANPDVWPVVLGISTEQMDRVLYYMDDVVDDPGDSGLLKGKCVPHGISEMLRASGKTVTVKSGFEGLDVILQARDLKDMYEAARDTERQCMAFITEERNRIAEEHGEDCAEDTDEIANACMKLAQARVKIDAVLYAKAHYDRLRIDEVNVMPLQIRSILNEEQRTMPYAADDLKYLYNRVQMRNNRLKMLMEVNAPEIVIRNEKRTLQETADTLIANGKRGYTIMRTGTENDEIRMQSLTDVILRNTRLV